MKSKVLKITIVFLCILVMAIVFLFGLWYLFTGSLEIFPTPEKEEGVRIFALFLLISSTICGILLFLTRKR